MDVYTHWNGGNVDWNGVVLVDWKGVVLVDWNEVVLVDWNGVVLVDWNGVVLVDWNGVVLVDWNGVVLVDWNGNMFVVLFFIISILACSYCYQFLLTDTDLPNECTVIGTKGSIKICAPFWCSEKIIMPDGTTKEFPLPKPCAPMNFINSTGMR